MHTGGCLCGKVRYEYAGELEEISMCHCSQCRKAQGSAFVAISPISTKAFRLLQGGTHLKEFRASPGKVRVFCKECGSPLFSARDDLPETLRLRIGTLDTPVHVASRYHTFVASKANWFDVADGLPQHPGSLT